VRTSESIILSVPEFGYMLLVDAQFGFSSTDFFTAQFPREARHLFIMTLPPYPEIMEHSAASIEEESDVCRGLASSRGRTPAFGRVDRWDSEGCRTYSFDPKWKVAGVGFLED